MKFGLLRKRITLETSAPTQDAAGQPIDAWSPLATVWARVTPGRGGEQFTADQRIGTAVTTFRIRFRTNLTVKDRISWDGRIWDIRDIREVGNKEALDVDATARSE